MDLDYIHTYLKQNKTFREVYYRFWKFMRSNEFVLEKLRDVHPVGDSEENYRLNLVIPSMTQLNIFGGINTAIDLFVKILSVLHCDARIVVLGDEKFNRNRALILEGFSYNKESAKEVFYLSDYNYKLQVRKNDIFLCTSWKTAHAIKPIMLWQKEKYSVDKLMMIYLIQDYEPGFYCWSAEYLLADNTYRQDGYDIMAIFNSKQLYDFFELKGYSFKKKLYFNPYLNANLKEYLLKTEKCRRKKQILFYGRPGSKRNAYELVWQALVLWSRTYENASEWDVIAVGDYTGKNKLETGKEVRNLGKLSLDEYAQIMLESYAAISLMVSPHPSYPPLEMSTFGVKTITNTYENKDLSDFNKNIYSVPFCSVENIAKQLSEICESYSKNQESSIELESGYVNGRGELDYIVEVIGKEIIDYYRME